MAEQERQIAIDYKNCFTTDSGKKVLADLRKIFNFDLSVIPKGDDGHTDIYEVLRNEGKRSVVLHIIKTLEKDTNKPEAVPVKQENYI